MASGATIRLTGEYMRKRQTRFLITLPLAALMLSGCNPEVWENNRHLQPLNPGIKNKIRKIGSTKNAPLYIRIFKEEAVLEAWKQRKDGTYALLETYPICAYSGTVGPKKREGDRQAPEGFYAITPGQMNPNSSYHLSFNLGYPNKFDRSYGRTGAHLMVHGDCSSRGCYAMENEPIAEIYALGREAFVGGQKAFKVHAFPFRMTPENMARHRNSEHFEFWKNLKNGYDHFQVTRKPPVVEVCNRSYVFNPQGGGSFAASGACPDYNLEPSLLASLTSLRAQENARFQKEVTRLETKQAKKAEAADEAMMKAQLKLIKAKEQPPRDPAKPGFFANIIGQQKPAEAAQITINGKEAPAASTVAEARTVPLPAPRTTEKAQSSGGFLNNIGSRLRNPFGKKKIPPEYVPLPEEPSSAASIALPQSKQ